MMPFIVVERVAADGTVRVLVPHPAEDRSAALEALSAAIAAGDVAVSGEVFVVDLSAATPVLLMPAPVGPVHADDVGEVTAPASADTVLGDLAEALKRAAVSLESEGIVAPESVESADDTGTGLDVEHESDEAARFLGEAVEAAIGAPAPTEEDGSPASALYAEEAEPAVEVAAPEPLAPPLEELADESDSASTGEVADVAVDEVEPPSEAALVEPVGDEAWPWANVDAFPSEEPATPAVEPEVAPDSILGTASVEDVTARPLSDEGSGDVGDVAIDDVHAAIASLGDAESVALIAEPASVSEPMGVTDLPAETEADPVRAAIDALDEPAVTESPLIVPSLIEGEEAYLPKPVILGDYDDTPATDGVGDGSSGTDVAESALPDEIALEEPSVTGFSAAASVVAEGEAPAEADPFAAAYEPIGGLDLGEYTCDDCVYVNTCPKVGQSTPAECGSFQWKSD